MKQRIKKFLEKEFILGAALLLLIVFSALFPSFIPEYPEFIHWPTLLSLTGLLIIVTAINQTGYISSLARRLMKRIKNERILALVMVGLSVVLSAFLTNDISLFIIVPLTLSLQSLIENDISKLIVFEAIGVNVGSALMPIGNPQNLFLWHSWGIHFTTFILQMLPIVVVMLAVLLVMTFLSFPHKQITVSRNEQRNPVKHNGLFILSIVIFAIFIFSLEQGWLYYVVPVIFLIYLFFYPSVLKRVDWILLVLIAVFFVDFTIPARLPAVKTAVHQLGLHSPRQWYVFSALCSQIISNVPAAIFTSNFTQLWRSLAFGVNIGGNGIVIGSLANLIALRMAGDRKIWLTFHKYSIPFFLITLLLGLLVL